MRGYSNMWYEWLFDGIGTEIVGVIVGLAVSGTVLYKFLTRNKKKQTQKAGDNAKQCQELEIETNIKENGKIRNGLKQTQKAGDNADQSQIGRIKNESK